MNRKGLIFGIGVLAALLTAVLVVQVVLLMRMNRESGPLADDSQPIEKVADDENEPAPAFNLTLKDDDSPAPAQPSPTPSLGFIPQGTTSINPDEEFDRMLKQMEELQSQMMPSFGLGSGFGRSLSEELAEMDKLMDDMRTRAFSGAGFGFDGAPLSEPVIEDAGNSYKITLEVPGLDDSTIRTRIRDRMLVISGETVSESNRNTQGVRQFQQSRQSFQQSFSLPGPVKPNSMQSTFKDGVLTITVEKSTAGGPANRSNVI